jgi:hypothetical protein
MLIEMIVPHAAHELYIAHFPAAEHILDEIELVRAEACFQKRVCLAASHPGFINAFAVLDRHRHGYCAGAVKTGFKNGDALIRMERYRRQDHDRIESPGPDDIAEVAETEFIRYPVPAGHRPERLPIRIAQTNVSDGWMSLKRGDISAAE